MLHRDEIHGDIRYDDLAVALLDTSQLQRLGRVYQLGYGHLVYRGGTHTRLSHSMGAYYTAAHLANGLKRNYEGSIPPPQGALPPRQFLPQAPGTSNIEEGSSRGLTARWQVLGHLVSWAGLLHDVGHIPIGHTLEDEFANIYDSHDAFQSPRFGYLWLDPNSEIASVLKSVELYPPAFKELGITNGELVLKAVMLIAAWKERNTDERRIPFKEILEDAIRQAKEDEDEGKARGATALRSALDDVGPLFHPYMTDVVANTISADYLDYLRRDPHNLGLDVLRDGRLTSRFWVGKDDIGQARMALSLVDRRNKPRLDTCTSVVELVRQRYRFAEIVYYHKTKVAASAMLAKVFYLLDIPPEIPQAPRTPPTIGEAEARTAELFGASSSKQRSKLLGALRADTMPQSMLDPEIGDEGLGLFLRGRALEVVEERLKPGADDHAEEKAADALRAIALLDGLARRRLYKTAFTMDSKLFPQLAEIREMPTVNQERRLHEFIDSVRGDAALREEIERRMVEAAGWPRNSILLYVPDRKNQAKGIETGALANGVVVTLGSHSAVADEVEKLSERYRALWRLIVLVHPDHADDVVGLSAAIDAFVEDQFGGVSFSSHALIDALEHGCWFPYQSQGDRSVAVDFASFLDREARRSERGKRPGRKSEGWRALAEYRDAHRTASQQQRLRGAMVLHRMKLDLRADGGTAADAVSLVGRLGSPEDLDRMVQTQVEAAEASGSLLGEADGDMATRALDEAVARIAEQLGPDA